MVNQGALQNRESVAKEAHRSRNRNRNTYILQFYWKECFYGKLCVLYNNCWVLWQLLLENRLQHVHSVIKKDITRNQCRSNYNTRTSIVDSFFVIAGETGNKCNFKSNLFETILPQIIERLLVGGEQAPTVFLVSDDPEQGRKTFY